MAKTNQTTGAADTLPAQAGTVDTPAVKTKAEEAGAGFFCYIGPSMMGLIQHGTIYRGTRETALAAASLAIKKYPLVKTLIVSGDKLPEARLKVKTPGNVLYQNYQRVAAGKG